MTEEKLWNANFIKVCISNFLIKFSFTLIVPLLPLYLSETFGASKDTIGLVLAGYTVMAILVRPFSGYIVDSFPRKTVMLICNFVFFSLFAGYLFASSLTLFAIVRTLHGAPFGAVTVANSTMAIDVVPASRRGEAISYYGLSNNVATALGPVLAIVVLKACGGNFNSLFLLSLLISLCSLVLDSTIKADKKILPPVNKVLSLDRFFLLKGFRQAINICAFAFSYGIISTYVAIYCKEELGISGGTGAFFLLFAVGLMISRITGARTLKRNLVSRNAAIGILVSLAGYLLFAAVHKNFAFYAAAFIIGLGNGHMYPAFQTMFVNLAEHNQRGTANSSMLTSWDAGTGLGVLVGGMLSEFMGYHAAFYFAFGINLLGTLFFYCCTRSHFEKNKLR
ncbi:MAG: MFS transporter [Candidatus Cryptobacteroides sp.]